MRVILERENKFGVSAIKYGPSEPGVTCGLIKDFEQTGGSLCYLLLRFKRIK